MSPFMFEAFVRIMLTVFLCGVIGWEREISNKVAGLRTHILVGVGSALLVLTSFYIFDIYKTQVPIDPTRIIAGIVTGIGFLCAGTIIRAGDNVIGLTTAATLWIVSGIGMAVGAGLYDVSTFVTLVVFIVLVGMRSVERKIRDKNNNHHHT